MTRLCVANWDCLADDVACIGCFYAHCGFMLLRLFPLCLHLCVDPLLLCNEIICVFLCLKGV